MTEEARARELLACPFCGDSDLAVVETAAASLEWCAVRCGKCDFEGPATDIEVRAIAAWNTRAALKPDPVAGGDASAFYNFADQLIHWMNATDSGEMTVQQFRSALNVQLLDMRPAAMPWPLATNPTPSGEGG